MMTSRDLIPDECVKAALTADKGSKAELLTWTVEDIVSEVDNYAALVTSVKVKFSLEQEEHNVSYVVKLSPDPKKIFGGFAEALFKKEVGFYGILSNALSSELERVGEVALRVPKCFYMRGDSGKEIIFLENLLPRGFKMNDRSKGLDVAHTKLILQELARFHAASLLLLAKVPDRVLDHRYDFIKIDWTNFSDNAKDFLKDFFSMVMKKNSNILHLVGGYRRVEEWLARNSERGCDMMESHLQTDVPFDVICHGDCWNNNLLFRYSDTGVPLEVMLLDMQVCRRASPALDLNNLLFTSLPGRLRKANTDDFLATYYDSLSKVLKGGGMSPPFTLPELQHEYRNKHGHGLFFGMLSGSTVVSEACGMPILGTEEEKHSSQKKFTREMLLDCKPLRPLLLDVFDEMVEVGLI
ncbi:uncharacterized protein [Panulirus ornatus]